MNKRMLKLTALVLAFLLVFAGISANAQSDTPTVSAFGNETAPALPGADIKLYVRLDGFSAAGGLDISITVPEEITLSSVAVDSFTLTQNKNYTLSGNEIHIVDVFNILNKPTLNTANIDITAKVADTAEAGSYEMTVSGVVAAKDGKTRLKEGTLATGEVVIREAEQTAQAGTLTAAEGMFIPYGSVYGTDAEFTEKLANGSFNASADTKYTQFRLGKNGITTFGVSFAEDNTAVQFGTYADDKAGKTYGTMCMIGDWDAFKEYYRTVKGYSEAQLAKMVSDRYDTVMAANPDATHVIMRCNNQTVEIAVYKVAQTKYMWGRDHATDLQYALRIREVEQGQQYTAVGYFTDSDGTTLSTEIKFTGVQ